MIWIVVHTPSGSVATGGCLEGLIEERRKRQRRERRRRLVGEELKAAASGTSAAYLQITPALFTLHSSLFLSLLCITSLHFHNRHHYAHSGDEHSA